MAIVQNPITGKTKKSFGNAIFSSQYGKNTMRSKPLEVRNPNTPLQAKQRLRFGTIIKLLRPLVWIINRAYAGTLRTMSAFHWVVGLNIRNAFTGDPPVLDHTKVVLCDADGSIVSDVVLTTKPDHVVHVDWDPNTTDTEELGSSLTFILFNCTTNEVQVRKNLALRSAGTVDFPVPGTWAGSMASLFPFPRKHG